MAKKFKVERNDDWLQKRQGLALPALPPTTQEARQYYFTKIRDFTESATNDGKKHVNFEAFAQEWNRTADGKQRFYVTFEVLSAYAKGWEKTSNISATQELMSEQMQGIKTSAKVFAAGSGPFPAYMVSTPTQSYPSQGVVQLLNDPEASGELTIPSSLVTDPSTSRSINFLPDPVSQHPRPFPNAQTPTTSTQNLSGHLHEVATTPSLGQEPPLLMLPTPPLIQPSSSNPISRQSSK